MKSSYKGKIITKKRKITKNKIKLTVKMKIKTINEYYIFIKRISAYKNN